MEIELQKIRLDSDSDIHIKLDKVNTNRICECGYVFKYNYNTILCKIP